LNGSIAFYLEAKKVQELTEKDLKQAVNYARSKNKRWAVLSNFKETIILLGDIKETSIIKHVFRRISYTELESNIDDLLLLSKEGFLTVNIEKKAQDEGRVKKVVKMLLNDILNWRQKIISSIKKNSNKEYSKEELEEIVQILLNRIIFIRTAEDRKHEAKPDETIRGILNQYEKDKSISIKDRLNKLFKQYDEVYDSKLFTYDELNPQKRHECERVEIDNSTYYKVLKETYHKDEIYTYQFNEIDADILGSMYEMYIGVSSPLGKSKVSIIHRNIL
jgi:adenine-specific DNA-methyltransferase